MRGRTASDRTPALPLVAVALAVAALTAGCDLEPVDTAYLTRTDGSAPAPASPTTVDRAEPEPDQATSPGDLPDIDLSAHSTTDPASLWVVVNKLNPLGPIDFQPELAQVRGYLVQPVVVDDLAALLAAADDDGVHLTIRSAYRSYGYQSGVYDGWVRSLGREQADRVSARPGHSEHQTGLAVDLGGSSSPECDFKACFDDTTEGRWIAENAGTFGFILRYTSHGTAVTGFDPEGWHLRYVGRELAAFMDRHGIHTLEEVFDVPGGSDYG